MLSASLLVSLSAVFENHMQENSLKQKALPSPATVYGFLLSLVGEEDRKAYLGTKLALAVVEEPAVSTIIRTTWRIKIKKIAPGTIKTRSLITRNCLLGWNCTFVLEIAL